MLIMFQDFEGTITHSSHNKSEIVNRQTLDMTNPRQRYNKHDYNNECFRSFKIPDVAYHRQTNTRHNKPQTQGLTKARHNKL